MAYNRSHINTNGSFNTSQKQSLLKTFDEVDGGSATPAPTPLTSGAGTAGAGTADGTATYSQTVFNNNFATVVGKINALITALKTAGVLT